MEEGDYLHNFFPPPSKHTSFYLHHNRHDSHACYCKTECSPVLCNNQNCENSLATCMIVVGGMKALLLDMTYLQLYIIQLVMTSYCFMIGKIAYALLPPQISFHDITLQLTFSSGIICYSCFFNSPFLTVELKSCYWQNYHNSDFI